MIAEATKLLDGLKSNELRDRLRHVEEERAALIVLIRATRARERAGQRYIRRGVAQEDRRHAS